MRHPQIFLFTGFALATFVATAGADPGWQVELYGFAAGDFNAAHDVTAAADGNVVAVGSVKNTTGTSFTVVKLDSDDGAQLWRREFDSGNFAGAESVVVDADDNVLASGNLGGGFAVTKLDGVTGADIWAAVVDPGQGATASRVVLDPSGDVIAGGGISPAGTSFYDFAVVKFDPSNGAELWRYVLPDSGFQFRDLVEDVVVDASGDIFAGGWRNDLTFTVAKLAGATGAELWRTEFPIEGRVRSLAMAGNGDVYAAGILHDGFDEDFGVVRFDGITGAEVWRMRAHGDNPNYNEALAVEVDGNGDVVASGLLRNDNEPGDFAVVKVAGASGVEQWRTVLPRVGSGIPHGGAKDVDLYGNGDVLAVGRTSNRRGAPGNALTAVKLDGATGDMIWFREIDSANRAKLVSVDDQALAGALDASGDALVVGILPDEVTGNNFTVVKLNGSTGLTVPECSPVPLTTCNDTAGKSKITITDRGLPGADADGKDKLKWSRGGGTSTAFAALGPMLGSSDVRACLYDGVGGVASLAMSIVIPGGGTCDQRGCWRAPGSDLNPKGYKYKDKTGSNGGVQSLQLIVNTGKPKIRLGAQGANLLLPGPISPSTYFEQNPSVLVQLTTSKGACWDADFVPGSSTKNRADIFSAR